MLTKNQIKPITLFWLCTTLGWPGVSTKSVNGMAMADKGLSVNHSKEQAQRIPRAIPFIFAGALFVISARHLSARNQHNRRLDSLQDLRQMEANLPAIPRHEINADDLPSPFNLAKPSPIEEAQPISDASKELGEIEHFSFSEPNLDIPVEEHAKEIGQKIEKLSREIRGHHESLKQTWESTFKKSRSAGVFKRPSTPRFVYKKYPESSTHSPSPTANLDQSSPETKKDRANATGSGSYRRVTPKNSGSGAGRASVPNVSNNTSSSFPGSKTHTASSKTTSEPTQPREKTIPKGTAYRERKEDAQGSKKTFQSPPTSPTGQSAQHAGSTHSSDTTQPNRGEKGKESGVSPAAKPDASTDSTTSEPSSPKELLKNRYEKYKKLKGTCKEVMAASGLLGIDRATHLKLEYALSNKNREDIIAMQAAVRKAYMKTSLLAHPDKNKGEESEYAPIFQCVCEAKDFLLTKLDGKPPVKGNTD